MRMYINQKIRVRWGNATSPEYTISNGVKQGGVMSPVLFTVYLDELLLNLKSVGFGCHVGGSFSGALAYADDVCLLAPSLSCLREMLRTVEAFAGRSKVLFNATKSALVTFGHGYNESETVLEFMGQGIPSVPFTKHLGFIIGKEAEKENINRAIADLFARTNCLRAQFGHVSWRVRLQLFRSFCLHLYGCETWDMSSATIQPFLVAYRKCIRHIVGLPYRTHRALIGPITSSTPIDLQIMNRISKFVNSISNSPNPLVKSCALSVILGSGSKVSNSISKICATNNISRYNLVNRTEKFHCPEIDHVIESTALAAIEMLDAIDDPNILPLFNFDELRHFLAFVCTW